MSTRAIVSYDDSPNDQDALMLGRLLADAGVELTLAYVRHATESESRREQLEDRRARMLLARGAEWIESPQIERRVIVSASTSDGLRRLAEEEGADIIVFGSEYRTPSGHVAPPRSTEKLLQGGTTAVAIAPAGYREQHSARVRAIGLLASPGDDAAIDTARELAERYDATITRHAPSVDLLVVGSRPEAPVGKVMISAVAERAIEAATSPVLVMARGMVLQFAELVLQAV
jgi:nucleotide-binding universal stress UspA family protein